MDYRKLSVCVLLCVFMCQTQSQSVFEDFKNRFAQYQIQPSDQVTLLVGLTGSGKTTLAKFLSDDKTNLVSVLSSNEYRIVDQNDEKISNNESVPKTFAPDQYIDSLTADVIIDCPSFDDSRSEIDEIAIYAFMDSMHQWTKRVKIIIVIDEDDVQPGGSEVNFLRLLNHLAVLFSNYNECWHSVGVVVTKGKSKPGNLADLDITTVADFLQKINKGLKSSELKTSMSYLLREDKTGYTNIAVFRRPQEKGELKESKAFKDEKLDIRATVFSSLEFASSKNLKFNYTLSKETKSLYAYMAEQVKVNIQNIFVNVTNEVLLNDYSNTLRRITDYIDFQKQVEADMKWFELLLRKMNLIKTRDDQCEWFTEMISMKWPQKYQTTKQIMTNLKHNFKDLDFLRGLSIVEIQDLHFANLVSAFQRTLSEWTEWIKFMLAAFNKMATYTVQSEKSLLDVAALSNWDAFKNYTLQVQGIFGYTSVVAKLDLKKSQQFVLEDLLHTVLDDTRLADSTPNSDTCELIMEGNFVKLSDHQQMRKVCGDKELSALLIFAQDTVFIDESFEAIDEEMLVGFAAPKWQVIGTPTISLNGSNGMGYNEPSTSGDGNAGMPGKPSGLFFGIVDKVMSSNNLKIYVRGGAGGDGQHGKNGTDGHGNIDVGAVYNYACNSNLYDYECHLNSSFFELNSINYELNRLRCEYSSALSCPKHLLEIKIQSGPEPTTGYRGGKQGLGGLHSKSTQVIAVSSTFNRLYKNDGAVGKVGIGGVGGLGSFENGTFTMSVATTHTSSVINQCGLRACEYGHFTEGTRAQSASNGLDNSSGTQTPPAPAMDYNTYDIISNFRLRVYNETLSKQFSSMDNSQSAFLFNLKSKSKNLVNLSTLISEFVSVEALRRTQPNNLLWMDVYDILLQSVESNITVTSIAQPPHFNLIVNYLSAAIISRRLDLQYQNDNNFVVDTRLFLEEVVRQFDEFARQDHTRRINEIQILFHQDVLKKQHDGDNYINLQYQTEMEKVQDRIETSIQDLRDEWIVLLGPLEGDHATRLESISRARMNIRLNTLFDVLQTFAIGASLFIPGGQLTAGVIGLIGLGTEIEGKFLRNFDYMDDTKKILLNLQNFQKMLKEDLVTKTSILRAQLDSAAVEIPAQKSRIQTARSILNNSAAKATTIYAIQYEVYHTIQSSQDLSLLKTTIFMTDPATIETYTKFYRSIQTAKLLPESTGEELDLLDAQLRDIEELVRKGAEYKELVENVINQQLENFIGLLKALVARTTESTAIGTEIARFGLRDAFEDLKLQLNLLTAGLESSEDFISCINTMEYLLTTAANVYGHMQIANDQINFGNLITNINILKLKDFNNAFSDLSLVNSLQKLETTIVSSTLRNQFTRAVNSFKQSVFPFGPLFMDFRHISEDIGPQVDEDGILSMLKSMLGRLVAKDSTIIQGYDDFIVTESYENFYVWNEVEFQDTILELLSGKEVYLRSDVLNSFANAVKFSDIRLMLTAKNADDQRMLDTLLKNVDIKLTHMGHSRYRCGEKFFIVPHQPQIVEYSFEMDANGEPLRTNDVFKKIRSGHILLSPYTVWKFQVVDKNRTNFDVSRFYGKTKLSLTGQAQYLKLSNSICQLKSLESYYQLDGMAMANSK